MALLSTKWRELTSELSNQGNLNDDSFGKVPKKLCHDPIIILKLQYNISWITWKSYAKGKGDASECFYLILPCLTPTVSTPEGMPKTIFVVHISTLEQARYHLKLMLNVMDRCYFHRSLTPIYGNGQGSTNSPSAWLFISNYIFKCHNKRAHRTKYQDPERQHIVQLYLWICGQY